LNFCSLLRVLIIRSEFYLWISTYTNIFVTSNCDQYFCKKKKETFLWFVWNWRVHFIVDTICIWSSWLFVSHVRVEN